MRNNDGLIALLKADLSRITTPTLKSFFKCYFFTRGGIPLHGMVQNSSVCEE